MANNHKSYTLGFLLVCAAALLAGALTPPAAAQTRTLRVVTYNIEDDIDGATTPLPGLIFPWNGSSTGPGGGGVLEGIGEEIVGPDPAQPLDILALEETTSNPATVAPIVSGLNAYYNAPGMYTMSPHQATESDGDTADGNGPNALVYNTATVQLVASVPVDPPGGTNQLGSASGEYREVMRYEFAPVGMTPAASNEFYVYVSHYKSGTTSDDLTDREGEAQIIRNDEAANLPANARVLYVGDYNVTASGEAAYQTILAASTPGGATQGQGFDPLNPSGATNINWGTNTTNRSILAMESESATDLRYRDDLQLMTSNVYYGAPGGLALVPGTYHAFGNNGTTPYNGNIGSSSNTALNTNLAAGSPITAATLRIDLTNASDHLPVVVDYTIPGPNLSLGNPVVSAADGFQFTVANADGTPISAAQQSRIGIYAATDLAQPAANWAPITNVTLLADGSLQITDPNSPSFTQRFYRATQPP